VTVGRTKQIVNEAKQMVNAAMEITGAIYHVVSMRLTACNDPMQIWSKPKTMRWNSIMFANKDTGLKENEVALYERLWPVIDRPYRGEGATCESIVKHSEPQCSRYGSSVVGRIHQRR
jgi:hypothetical protein